MGRGKRRGAVSRGTPAGIGPWIEMRLEPVSPEEHGESAGQVRSYRLTYVNGAHEVTGHLFSTNGAKIPSVADLLGMRLDCLSRGYDSDSYALDCDLEPGSPEAEEAFQEDVIDAESQMRALLGDFYSEALSDPWGWARSHASNGTHLRRVK